MTYKEFTDAYIAAFKKMKAYEFGTVGNKEGLQEMANLADEHPEYAEALDEQIASMPEYFEGI